MKIPTLVKWGATALMVGTLAACGGGSSSSSAPAAVATTPPAAAPAGVAQNGTNSVAATATAAAAWTALAPQVAITGVTVNSPPVVKFTVKDAAGAPVLGLGNKSQSTSATMPSLTNIAFTLAKLVPGTNGAPSKWVSYLVVRPATVAEKTAVPKTASCDAATNATWCGTFPTSDAQGTLIDFGDGSYQYTFYRDPKQAATIVASLTDSVDGLAKKADLGDVSFDANATTRLGIQIGGQAPGTGSNYVDATTFAPISGGPTRADMVNTANVVYDFIPATGKAITATDASRNIVKIESCNGCHAGKVLAHGSRKDPQYCMTCHTDQIKYTFSQEATPAGAMTLTGTTRPTTAIVDGRALGNFPNMVHKIHMGEGLVKKGYYFNAASEGKFNEFRYPQDIRNCTKCHDGSATAVNKTDNGDNWKSVPSALACGACHDGINFKTGMGVTLADAAEGLTSTTIYGGKAHGGGPVSDDSSCALCHKPTNIDISASHIPVSPADPGDFLLGGTNTHAPSAPIAANHNNLPAGAIKVTYDVKSVSVNASGNPVVVFKMLQNGTATPFNKFGAGKTEIWDNYYGSPQLYFAWAEPQDGVTAPADFNKSASIYLRSLWNGVSAGTLAGPDATTGYYTATLTATKIPTTAVMVTGGVGFGYGSSSQPLTQTNVSGYPAKASTVDATKLVGGLTVAAPTVSMVATDSTGKSYTGRRVIVETARCNACHEKMGVFTESSFHVGQRNDATTCAWCHTPNRTSSGWSVDSASFIHAIHAAGKRSDKFTYTAASATDGFFAIGYPGVLQKCDTCHLPGTSDLTTGANRLYKTVATGAGFTTAAAATSFSFAPAKLVPRDLDFGAAGAGTNLVSSPISAVCFSCHDGKMVSDSSTDVRVHIENFGGGSIYQARTTALVKQEQCALCHKKGAIADITTYHK